QHSEAKFLSEKLVSKKCLKLFSFTNIGKSLFFAGVNIGLPKEVASITPLPVAITASAKYNISDAFAVNLESFIIVIGRFLIFKFISSAISFSCIAPII